MHTHRRAGLLAVPAGSPSGTLLMLLSLPGPSAQAPGPHLCTAPPHFIQPSAQMALAKEPSDDEIAPTLPVSIQLPSFILIMTLLLRNVVLKLFPALLLEF